MINDGMTRVEVEAATEAEWLAARQEDITSTESSALFGVSPYATLYKMWHIKNKTLEDDFSDTPYTRWGRRLEAAIATGVAEDLGLIVEPMKEYMRIPEHRLGSSFDFRVVGIVESFGDDNEYRDLFRERGDGILEVKNVSGWNFKRSWEYKQGATEAPPHIEVQIQHQMLVSGLTWAMCAPLVDGNEPRPFWRTMDERYVRAITKKAGSFWSSIEEDSPPEPDYEKDKGSIVGLNLHDDGSKVDMTDDDYLNRLCVKYKQAQKDEKEAKKMKDSASAEIIDIIGPAHKVLAKQYRISCKTRDGSPGKLITGSMVGTRTGQRKPSRFPTITEIKE